MKPYAVQTQKKIHEAKRFVIGMAEQQIAQAPDTLVTLGLGSCIGLVLYDSAVKIAGMVHIMLPCASADTALTNRFKFADTAIAEMIRMLTAQGALRHRLKAKMAGGAHMFSIASTMNILNVGQRNIAMCRQILSQNNISVLGEDTGGSCGRSIEFCCESSTLSVRTVAPRSMRII